MNTHHLPHIMPAPRPIADHLAVRIWKSGHRPDIGLALAGVALLTVSMACRSPDIRRIEIFAIHEGTNAIVGTASVDHISLAGAIGETVSFHIALSTAGEPIDGVGVILDPFVSAAGQLPPNSVTLWRSLPVVVEQYPGWHIRLIPPAERRAQIPDALVPLSAPHLGPPWTITPDEPITLWADVYISGHTLPGQYRSVLTITRPNGAIEAIPTDLTVWPFKLPDALDGALIAPLDHQALFAHHVTLAGRPYDPLALWSDSPLAADMDELLTRTMALLESHRLTPVLHRLRPTVKLGFGGRVTVEWDDYDRVAAPFINGDAFGSRLPIAHWPAPLDDSFPMAPTRNTGTSPTYDTILGDYLADVAGHFADRGWLDRCYVELPLTRTPNAAGFGAAARFGAIAHGADSRLRRMARLFPQDLASFGWEGFDYRSIDGSVDIWCPPACYYDVQASATQRERGRDTWFEIDRPPFSGSVSIAAPSTCQRSLAWQMFRYRASAVMLDTVNRWPPPDDALSAQSCLTYDAGVLIYPGSIAGVGSPLPSVRLKHLRRGMQDLGYLRMLTSLGGGHLADVLAESLVPFAMGDAYGAHLADGRAGGWARDPAVWARAKRILAEEIRSRLSDSISKTQRITPAAVQWRQFLDATRKVDVRVDGVRVREAPPASPGTIAIDCFITITNHTRTPVQGRLQFQNLPAGWQTITDGLRLETLAPGRARRLVIQAHADVVLWNANGVRDLQLLLETDDGCRLPFRARLSFVAARAAEGMIQLDGDLSDWPSSIENRAGGFVLISGGPASMSTGSDRPRSPTEVMVARNADHLFLAFTCYSDRPAPNSGVQRNTVRYDDSIPLGEEAVEILIDPYSTGTRATGDLYHIVLKSGGSICERGVSLEPPTGPRRLWAADLEYAIAYYDDRWVAEARIPLAAFDEHARRQRIWAINFTRFDAQHQEYSTWAGARQNAYDPLSLGNMVMVEP